MITFLAFPFETKTFADDKCNVAEIIGFVFGKTENIVENRIEVAYKHFLSLPQCFFQLHFSQDP